MNQTSNHSNTEIPVLVIGLNHKTSSIEVRERVSKLCGIKPDGADGDELECIPVFTCNRFELYFSGDSKRAEQAFVSMLQRVGYAPEELADHLYKKTGMDAVLHLFRVAGGLDSMVIGECQILSQLKSSYNASVDASWVGKVLHRVFQKAFEVGKLIRARTLISENTISVASTAVHKAAKALGSLEKRSALVVGAGEMASLAALHLKKHAIGELTFVNRTEKKASDLAMRFNGRVDSLQNLHSSLLEADLVVTSTGAKEVIFDYSLLSEVMLKRQNHCLYIVDIALPRDVAPECKGIPGLHLYDIDDLNSVVEANIEKRKAEMQKAEKIAFEQCSEFVATLNLLNLTPIINDLKATAEKIRKVELSRLFDKFPELSKTHLNAIEEMSRGMAAKWLHVQIRNLKSRSSFNHASVTSAPTFVSR